MYSTEKILIIDFKRNALYIIYKLCKHKKHDGTTTISKYDYSREMEFFSVQVF